MPAAKMIPERPPESDLMTHEEAAAYLRIPAGSLYQWISRGRPAPRSVRLGRYRRYRKADLDAFIESQASK